MRGDDSIIGKSSSGECAMRAANVTRLVCFLVLATVIVVLAVPAQAQNKSVVVPRRDVDIVILASGTVQVNETWQVQFSGGPFTFAFRGVTLDKVDSVAGFNVSENGRNYQQSTSNAANTFEVYQDSGQQFVKWYF